MTIFDFLGSSPAELLVDDFGKFLLIQVAMTTCHAHGCSRSMYLVLRIPYCVCFVIRLHGAPQTDWHTNKLLLYWLIYKPVAVINNDNRSCCWDSVQPNDSQNWNDDERTGHSGIVASDADGEFCTASFSDLFSKSAKRTNSFNFLGKVESKESQNVQVCTKSCGKVSSYSPEAQTSQTNDRLIRMYS